MQQFLSVTLKEKMTGEQMRSMPCPNPASLHLNPLLTEKRTGFKEMICQHVAEKAVNGLEMNLQPLTDKSVKARWGKKDLCDRAQQTASECESVYVDDRVKGEGEISSSNNEGMAQQGRWEKSVRRRKGKGNAE